MTIPQVVLTIKDGNAGPAPQANGIHIKVGLATTGPLNALLMFTDPAALRATFGAGPAVEAADFALFSGCAQVGVCRSVEVTAGSAGAVTNAGGGAGVIAVTGTPNDSYDVRVRITTAGIVGTAAFVYSLDGGDNYTAEIATAATYAVAEAGFTLGFTGTFTAGDVYSFATTAPSTNSAGMLTALNAALASPDGFEFAHIVGSASTVSAQLALVASASAACESAKSQGRYAFVMMDLPSDTDANIVAAVSPVVAKNALVCAGFFEAQSRKGTLEDRPAGWAITAHTAKARISGDPGWVGQGAVSNVAKIYRDEAKTPAFHDARIASLRSMVGRLGTFVTSVQSLNQLTSDYRYVQAVRVINVAANVVMARIPEYLNASVVINGQDAPLPGSISEPDATNIEANITAALSDTLLSYPDASSVGIEVSRTQNVASTNLLPVKIWVVPLATLRRIEVTLGIYVPQTTL